MLNRLLAGAALGALLTACTTTEEGAIESAAVSIPQATGATAGALLDLCVQVAPIANKFLLSDLAVSAELAMATVRCATYNVRINLADVSDRRERKHFEDATNQMLTHATERVRAAIPAIWGRLK